MSFISNITIDHLPNEILFLIISKLSVRQIVICSRVQKLWLELKEDALSPYALFFGKEQTDLTTNEAFLKAFFSEAKRFCLLKVPGFARGDFPTNRKIYYEEGKLNYQATLENCTSLSQKEFEEMFAIFHFFQENVTVLNKFHQFKTFIYTHIRREQSHKSHSSNL